MDLSKSFPLDEKEIPMPQTDSRAHEGRREVLLPRPPYAPPYPPAPPGNGEYEEGSLRAYVVTIEVEVKELRRLMGRIEDALVVAQPPPGPSEVSVAAKCGVGGLLGVIVDQLRLTNISAQAILRAL
jgi:hypothetical protein